MNDITISMILEIVPGPNGGFVRIPNCEPSTYIQNQSSTLINVNKTITCCGSMVRVVDVINAIPGAVIKSLPNSMINSRQILVLPPRTDTCPCSDSEDWYGIIRQLACESPLEFAEEECSVYDFGFCPDPDFSDIPEPQQYPYITEGST